MSMMERAPKVARRWSFKIAERGIVNDALERAIHRIDTGHNTYSCSAIGHSLREIIFLDRDVEYTGWYTKAEKNQRIRGKIFEAIRQLGLEPGSSSAFNEFYENPSLGSPIQARIIWLTTLNHLIQLGEI